MESLKKELDNLQSKTIGLFKNIHSKKIEFVVEKDKHVFKTICIRELAGAFESTYPCSNLRNWGTLKMFPDGKSLFEMKSDVVGLDNFLKEFDN